MYEFTPFCKTDNFKIESFIQFSRELITREEYKNLNPNAMLLYSILTDRLDLSYKQTLKKSKVQFFDAKGRMYVIFKREEIQEKLHIGRSAIDNALNLLKECNLIQEIKQGKNMPNIIYLGKTIGMIENEEKGSVENQQSGVLKNNTPDCTKSTLHNNYNNKYINNNNNSFKNNKNKYVGRKYKQEYLDKLYANCNFNK